MTDLLVREMQFNDVDVVYQIELIAHRVPWGWQVLHDCIVVAYDCRVLELDNQVIGYTISRYYEDICHLLNIAIAPSLHGKGYGRFLMQNLIDSLEPTQVANLVLEVRPSNVHALHLYQKIGFKEIGIKSNYYNEGPDIEDALVLQKNVKPEKVAES